jgi:hypothetical protein
MKLIFPLQQQNTWEEKKITLYLFLTEISVKRIGKENI